MLRNKFASNYLNSKGFLIIFILIILFVPITNYAQSLFMQSKEEILGQLSLGRREIDTKGLGRIVSDSPTVDYDIPLTVKPDVQFIQLGSGVEEILMVVQVEHLEQSNLYFEWGFDGPGKLLGNIHDPGILYVVPEKILKKIETVTIKLIIAPDPILSKHGNIMVELNFILLTPSTHSFQFLPVQNAHKGVNPNSSIASYSKTEKRLYQLKLKLLTYLQKNIYDEIQTYAELKSQEEQGKDVNDQIIESSRNIVDNLRTIEDNYSGSQPEMAAVAKRNRVSFENELLARMKRIKSP